MKSLLRCIALSLLLLAPVAASAQAPTVSAISDVSINAGTTRNLNVVAFSAGIPITLTANLPAYATLNGPTTGTGLVSTTISLAPMAANVGTFNASVTATSGALSSTESFLITVNASGSGQAPVVTAPAGQEVTAGSNLTFNVTAADADADAITSLTAAGPSGSSFTPNGTNTSGTFSWTPTSGQTGDFDVVFTAANALSGSATTHIHVRAATNSAPVLTAPSSRTVTETNALNFTVTATDADGDHVALSATGVPSGANAVDQGNNTLNFSWTPSVGQAGAYTVVFHGADGHGGITDAATAITVNAAGGNTPPTLTAPSTRTVTETNLLTFTVTASDVNGDHVTLSATGVPSGATAVDQGNNTLIFSWTPDNTQAGTYTVTFHGDDGHGGTVNATTTITVQNVGGGGGGGATVTVIGNINLRRDRQCFRIEPNGSFNPRDVDLGSVTLQFAGLTIHAVEGRVHMITDCTTSGGGGGGGDCDGGGHDDAARILRGGDGHGHGEGDDDNGDDCEDCGDDDDNPNCAAVALRACFSTHDLVSVFCDTLGTSLADATIHFRLNDGTEIVATFTGSVVVVKNHGRHKMDAMAMPNPLNPLTVLSFTLSQPGRVQVSVYDLQGRLVSKLSDEVRGVGPQSLAWDGSNSRNGHVSSGVYFFRIQAPEGQVVQRVAVVK